MPSHGIRTLWRLALLFFLVSTAGGSLDSTSVLIEEELVQETIAAGRGERQEPGIRDQWESREHLGAKYKIHDEDNGPPISRRVKALLHKYRLSCPGCNENQAVTKINAFVMETKEQAQRDAQRRQWVKALVTVLVLGSGGAFYLYWKRNPAPSSSFGVSSDARRKQMEEQRQRAIQRQEEALQISIKLAKEAPTWREQEEKEIWTPQQEQQFAKALLAFGGVPAKARYTLIADKVDGKNRLECLLHHKLLEIKAKEEKDKELS